MPTLYNIFNDMNLLGRFLLGSRYKLFLLSIHYFISAYFTLWASRSHCICFVAAQSQWMTTSSRAIEESVVISSFFEISIGLPHSLRTSQLSLQQPRLVNNPG